MLFGILASLLGAIGQAYNYAVTKDCQLKYQLLGIRLLACTFIFMGALLVPPFLLLGYYRYLEPEHFIYILRINIPFLLGQYCMLCALRFSDASIVSPLLALKVPVLCVISYLFFDLSLGVQQYLAVVLIVSIAACYSLISGTISLRSLFFVLAASTCYVCSDIGITDLSHAIPSDSSLEQVMAATCINYIAAGIIFLPLCPFRGITLRMIWQSRWPSITWIVSATAGVVGFNVSGLVSGNIIQSLRGVFGVVISFIFYRDEMVGSLSRRVFILKIVLSIAMVLSVALFYVDFFSLMRL